jgi:hypothetical protein
LSRRASEFQPAWFGPAEQAFVIAADTLPLTFGDTSTFRLARAPLPAPRRLAGEQEPTGGPTLVEIETERRAAHTAALVRELENARARGDQELEAACLRDLEGTGVQGTAARERTS